MTEQITLLAVVGIVAVTAIVITAMVLRTWRKLDEVAIKNGYVRRMLPGYPYVVWTKLEDK